MADHYWDCEGFVDPTLIKLSWGKEEKKAKEEDSGLNIIKCC
jgi:hypothetical protein